MLDLGSLVSNLGWFIVDSGVPALGIQFVCFLVTTLLIVYLVAWMTRKFTHIKSHFWILLESIVASLLYLSLYRFYLIFPRGWWLVTLLSLPVGVITEVLLARLDQGRSLVDVDADTKSLMHTDYRLIRRTGHFVLCMFIVLTLQSVLFQVDSSRH